MRCSANEEDEVALTCTASKRLHALRPALPLFCSPGVLQARAAESVVLAVSDVSGALRRELGNEGVPADVPDLLQ